MSAPSYLSTFLLASHLRGAEAFAARFAGEWLIWEPGPWQAPPVKAKTTLKVDPRAKSPQHGNALCFHLGPADGRTLTLGRELSSDVLITDGTVSRQHALLSSARGAWSIRALSLRDSQLNGEPLTSLTRFLPLGSTLVLGGVVLSFCDAAGLMGRLIPKT